MSAILKTREDVSSAIDEWIFRTKKPLSELAFANYAFFIDDDVDISDSYLVDFIKCRNVDDVITWFYTHLGAPGNNWDLLVRTGNRSTYNPLIRISGKHNLFLFKMVWE